MLLLSSLVFLSCGRVACPTPMSQLASQDVSHPGRSWNLTLALIQIGSFTQNGFSLVPSYNLSSLDFFRDMSPLPQFIYQKTVAYGGLKLKQFLAHS